MALKVTADVSGQQVIQDTEEEQKAFAKAAMARQWSEEGDGCLSGICRFGATP